MTTIQDALPSPSVEAAQPPMPDNTPAQPERRRLRLYLVGSQDDTQSAIDCLLCWATPNGLSGAR